MRGPTRVGAVLLLAVLLRSASASAVEVGAAPATERPSRVVRVRLLEREALSAVRVEAQGPVRCDGALLRTLSSQVTAERDQLAVSGRHCAVLELVGPVLLSSERAGKAWSRRYRGTLRLSAVNGTLVVRNEVELEDYLRSVVAAEQAPGTPLHALRALAVVARTFAASAHQRHGPHGEDLCDLTHCQLYPGASTERPEVDAAVAQTSGVVLLAGGVALRPAYFHAACGGATSSAADVFGESDASADSAFDGLGGLAPDGGAAASWCTGEGSAGAVWSWTVERAELARALGMPGKELRGRAFEPLRRDAASRVLELVAFGRRMSGAAFLSAVGDAFGYTHLKSMRVRAEEVEGVVRFTGEGRGHGVGLCQEGAKARAARGWDDARILRHYFPTMRPGRLERVLPPP